MNRGYKPMLSKLAPKPFSDKDWIFEIKWDGFRAIAYVNEEVSLRSRNEKELKHDFPELEELKGLTQNVVLDGEIVIMKGGRADFQSLLERGKAGSLVNLEIQTRRSPALYVVFDILEKDGNPLINLPLMERKRILRDSVRDGQHVLVSDFVEEKGEAYYQAALQKGLEGIMAKKRDSPYEPAGRSGSWLKIKRIQSCECVIFGYTKGRGTRKDTFGALILGLYGEGGQPVYVGKVGTGFSQEILQTLTMDFSGMTTTSAPFQIDIGEEITWLRPEHVCEVAYQAVTNDVRLRMPLFRGLRPDKPPAECTMDQIVKRELYDYLSKRDFGATTEPQGCGVKGAGVTFVVQEHHARRLHYDVRLEKDGVLKSWAVPKGMPDTARERRLAVEVEDHPLEYVDFEGRIPEGQYGAGTVKILDKGTYGVKAWEEDKIEFILHGRKLQGRYVLVRLNGTGKDRNWLLLKGRD
jgi:DNA ligase D-like protein (predicted ligase)/DNA ligase D-like protein (predicted 3'-phosphoesterase)